jgi:hypothetical protein
VERRTTKGVGIRTRLECRQSGGRGGAPQRACQGRAPADGESGPRTSGWQVGQETEATGRNGREEV